MEVKYFVCKDGKGISRYDLSNDTMPCMEATADKSEWMTFNIAEARDIARKCGYKIVRATYQ